MQSKVELLRFQRVYSWEKEGWFVPLADALEGLRSAEAAWQPEKGGNTIWQTVNHLNYWNEMVLSALNGNPQESDISNDATFGKPGNPDDTECWEDTVERTRKIEDELRSALEKLNDDELDRLSLTEVLPRWMMHDAYHTGQIVLLRKQQGSWPQNR